MARAHKGVAMTALTVRRCDAIRTTFHRKVDPKSSGTCLFTSRDPRLPVFFFDVDDLECMHRASAGLLPLLGR